jgi:predicted RNase H-like HicB family nuclease
MKKISLTVLIEKDEDGIFVASVPALRGCHTQARTYEELIPRIKEAIDLCIDSVQTEMLLNRFIGVQQLEITL